MVSFLFAEESSSEDGENVEDTYTVYAAGIALSDSEAESECRRGSTINGQGVLDAAEIPTIMGEYRRQNRCKQAAARLQC